MDVWQAAECCTANDEYLFSLGDIMSDLSGGVQTGGGNIETGFGDIVLNPL